MRKLRPTPALPKAGEGKRSERGHLGYLLRQAAAGYRLRLERALADLNVTPPQFAVMTMLAAYPGHSNADLARLALLTPQTVSVIVGNLERMGAVTRRPDAIHGRIQHLTLTGTGLALLASCRDRAQVIERDLVSRFTALEEQTIRRWLVRVAIEASARE